MTGFFDFVDNKQQIEMEDFAAIKKMIDQEGCQFFITQDDRNRPSPIAYSQRVKNHALEKFLQDEMLSSFLELLKNPDVDYELVEKMLQNDENEILTKKEEQHRGTTALYYVCVTKQDAKAAQLLVDYGADVDQKNTHNDFTLLEALARKDHILKRKGQSLTQEQQDNIDSVRSIIAENTVQLVQAPQEEMPMLEQLDQQDQVAMTPQRLLEIAQELKVKFVDNPVKKEYAKKGKKKVVMGESIKEIGADELVIHDRFEKTLLHVACFQGNVDIAKELVEAGAKVNALDENGVIPIYYACCSGNADLIKYMVEHGGDIIFQNNEGHSLLHALSDKLNRLSDEELKPMVVFLLDKGVDPTLYDKRGLLASYYMKDNRKESYQYLKNQADIIDAQHVTECNDFVRKYPNFMDDLFSYEGRNLSQRSLQSEVGSVFQIDEGFRMDHANISYVIYSLCDTRFLCDKVFKNYADGIKKIVKSFAQNNPDHVAIIPEVLENLEEASFDDLRRQGLRISYVLTKDLMASSNNKINSSNIVAKTPEEGAPCTTYLNVACRSGNMYLADLLLDDLMKQDETTQQVVLNFIDGVAGSSALGYCTKYNNEQSMAVAKKILDNPQARLDIVDVNGVTCPIASAIIRKNQPFVELYANTMIQQGKSIDSYPVRGETPLSVAMRFDNVEAVKFLMEKGADSKLVKPDIKAFDNDAVKEFKQLMRERISALVAQKKGETTQYRPSSPVQNAQASSLIEMQQVRL